MLHTPSYGSSIGLQNCINGNNVTIIALNVLRFAGPEFVINTAKLSPMMKGRNMCVLDEAINTETYFPKDAQALKKELGIDDDKIVVVTATSYSPDYKGGRYFDEAARLLENDERFLFVHIANDRQGIEHPQKNLIIRGYIETLEEMTVYFSMADIFLFPSLQDTMSNTCLEALACGTPLLCFNISGMPNLGDPSVLTLVEPRDSIALAEALKSTNKKTKKIEHCRNYRFISL